jgi:hypothetical protein
MTADKRAEIIPNTQKTGRTLVYEGDLILPTSLRAPTIRFGKRGYIGELLLETF